MGLHTDTSIYRTCSELFRLTQELIRNMPRDVKRHMGDKIRDELLDAIDAIYMANVAREKLPHIEKIRRHVARVELLLRQSVDLGFIVRPGYAKAVHFTQSIGRQATGWKKYSASHAPAA
jgi:hypothetical protein